jgi:RimJ/RimL family protein N-acetyltransferase
MTAFSERDAVAADAPWLAGLFAAVHAQPFMRQVDEATVRASLERGELTERIVLYGERAPAAFWRANIEHGWLAEIRTLVAAVPGTGAGSWGLRSALAWAFAERGVHRAYLYVTAANVRARALYERHGLQLEGTERDGFRNAGGSYEDLCVYGILENDYRGNG